MVKVIILTEELLCFTSVGDEVADGNGRAAGLGYVKNPRRGLVLVHPLLDVEGGYLDHLGGSKKRWVDGMGER